MFDIEEIEKERHFVCKGMQTYGGSFIQNLGKALAHADFINIIKIRAAWLEEWEKYLKMGKEIKGE